MSVGMACIVVETYNVKRTMLISVRYHVLLTQEQTQRKLFQCLTMSASVATELVVELLTTTVLLQ